MGLRRKMLGRDHAGRWTRRGDAVGARGERPQVLVEEPDAAEAFAYWRLLEDNGYRASWCPGPETAPGRRCPLVFGGRCRLVEQADVVVSSLGLHNESARRVFEALRRVHPEKPVVVEGPRPVLERYAGMLDGQRLVRMPVTGRAVLASVRDALGPPVAVGAAGPP